MGAKMFRLVYECEGDWCVSSFLVKFLFKGFPVAFSVLSLVFLIPCMLLHLCEELCARQFGLVQQLPVCQDIYQQI